jgi:hypothetical protein
MSSGAKEVGGKDNLFLGNAVQIRREFYSLLLK